MEEYFHRMYILGKVPQCVSFDMRQALHEKRVGAETERKWSPYLTSDSRYRHRVNIRRLHAAGKFDYYAERKAWIKEYTANFQNLKAAKIDARN